MNENGRRFSSRQRIALYLAQDGRCALCGVALMSGWHADHVNPWSNQGLTDVVNGQALCPTCNLKKGSKIMGVEIKKPRAWQIDAISKYYAQNKQDWLAKVTPGGGKTMFALTLAKEMIYDQTVERVIIVVPTDSLRDQWSAAANAEENDINLQLGTHSNGEVFEKPGFHGQVVTYAQVASLPEIYRYECGKHKVLVIFDECHHAGDNQSWGKAMEIAFETATKRLSMTGTPWRAPKRGKIPFVSYDVEGKLVENYKYDYEQAINDEVCRRVQFHAFDGRVTYVSLDSCVPMTYEKQLSEADEDDNSQVLRDILKADGNWMSSILRQAMTTLKDIRTGENGEGAIPDAKGLVVVHDRSEARVVAKLIEKMTYERPALIISDPSDGEPDPKEELNRFRTNRQVWAVAVDMVSEGVDIPALCVGVYATRKKTPLRFQQIVGRFIRMRKDEILTAIIFIPAVPSLLALAGEIERMLDHEVKDEEIESTEKRERDDSEGNEDEDEDEDSVKDTSEAEFAAIISHSEHFSETEIADARAICIANDVNIPARYIIDIAKLLRASSPMAKVETITPIKSSEPRRMSRQEEEKVLREKLNREIHHTAGKNSERSGIDIGTTTKDLNKKVISWYGKPRKKMSVEELRSALHRVKELGGSSQEEEYAL
jgi:superfamily II DNA or RNA helicase